MSVLFDYIDIFAFAFICVIKLLIFGVQASGSFYTLRVLIVPCLASVFILASLTCFCSKKKRARLLYTFNLIISLVIICDLNYYRYFKDLISIPVLKNGFQLTAVGSSVNSLFRVQDLLYLCDLIFLIPLIDHFKYKKAHEFKLKQKVRQFLILFVLGLVFDSGSIYILAKEQPRLLTTMFNRIYVANAIGDVNYHFIDAYNSIATDISKHTPVSKNDENQVKAFLKANNTSSSNSMKGILKGKNLIIIQVEALQNFVINQSVEGKEITPNLNKWIKKSVYFNNYFYQISAGGTSDAEFISNNSMYPAPSGSAYYLYSNNDYNSLAAVLKGKGYSTNVFHGFRQSFWNRNVMYPKEGFDRFYNEKDYNINEKIGLGLSDKSFFNQSIQKIKNLKEPYYVFMITLSSHYPYDDVKKYGNFETGKYENTLLGNYMKGIHYTDAEIGAFLDQLEKEGILKNSMLVIYGDHYAIPRTNQNELSDFLKIGNMNDLKWIELQKVPLIMHFPDEKYKGTNNLYTGQMDLYPALSNLFDLHADTLLGKDLFNSKEGTVIFRNGSFTDGKVFYISQTNTYYDISSGKIINESSLLKSKKEQYINELEYSDIMLKHNLMTKITGNK